MYVFHLHVLFTCILPVFENINKEDLLFIAV